MCEGIEIETIGVEGSIAAITGAPTDPEPYLARLLQQCDRDMGGTPGPMSGLMIWWTCRALYQQLVGSWTAADEHRLTWILYKSWRPSETEGLNRWASERTLTPEAVQDLARRTVLP